MQPISDAETFTLLLRDLAMGLARVAVVTGEEGSLDGLTLAAFFAGVVRRSFPGGVYLMAPQLTELEDFVSQIPDKAGGKILVIVSDSRFGTNYSLPVESLARSRSDLSLIVISRDSKFVTGQDLSINLNDPQSSVSPMITKLWDRTSIFDEAPPNGRILDN
jgi:hypothetical protein